MIDPKVLTIYQFDDSKKVRYGRERDGGYVIGKLDIIYDCYLSCGIATEESFTKDFLTNNKNIKEGHSFAFDGTIDKYPKKYSKTITFIKKNINSYNDNNNTNLVDLMNKYNNIFLSMDIEGGEYPWIMAIESKYLNKIAQIVIEFHGLTSNTTWGADLKTKEKCLQKLSTTHYLIHAHGNNFAPVENGIPDVIELTYINKKFFKKRPLENTTILPIKGLDFVNFIKMPDIDLNHPPFVYETEEAKQKSRDELQNMLQKRIIKKIRRQNAIIMKKIELEKELKLEKEKELEEKIE